MAAAAADRFGRRTAQPAQQGRIPIDFDRG
jgi:hypothetical protein